MIHRLHPLRRDPARTIESYGFIAMADFPWRGKMEEYAADRLVRRHLKESVPFGTTITLEGIPDLWRSVETSGRIVCHRYYLRHKKRFLPYMARYRCPAFVSPEGPVHGEDVVYIRNVSWILETLADREVRIRHPAEVYADSCLDFGYPFDFGLHGMCQAFAGTWANQCHPLFDGDEISWRIAHDTDLFESRMLRGDPGDMETFRTLTRLAGKDPVSQAFDTALAARSLSWFTTRSTPSPLSSFSLDPLPDEGERMAGPEYRDPAGLMFDLPLTDVNVDYTLRSDTVSLDRVRTCQDRLAGIAPHLEDVGRTLLKAARSLFQIAWTIEPETDRVTIEKTYLDEGRFRFFRKDRPVEDIYVDYALLGLTAPGAHVEE